MIEEHRQGSGRPDHLEANIKDAVGSAAELVQTHLPSISRGDLSLALRTLFDAPDTAHRCPRQQAPNSSTEQESFRISDRRRHLVSDSDRRSQPGEHKDGVSALSDIQTVPVPGN